MPKYLLASEIVDKVMPEGGMWGDFVNGPVHDGDPGYEQPETLTEDELWGDSETASEQAHSQHGYSYGRYL